jgi:S1-C subfamily serine protease
MPVHGGVVPAGAPAAGPSPSLPPWIYAALGGVGVLALFGVVLMGRLVMGIGAGQPANPADSGRVAAAGPESPPPATAPAPTVPTETPSPGDVVATATLAGLSTADKNPRPSDPAPGTTNTPAAAESPAPAAGGPAPLSTAQLVARCEPSVALVKGKVSSGTGFLIRPGVIATNAHVIEGEFLSDLEVRFPSAPDGQQGPAPVELLFEDTRRDLAFLKVASGLPALQVAPTYTFIKGDDITIIGNPGLGDDVVLENAVSRGVMSSKTTLEGLNYLQLSIAINPGNSGGPVFDPAGRVIGVATLKSSKAEALAFCIPVEEVNAGLARLDSQPGTATAAMASRHQSQLAFQMLTTAGVLYSIGLDARAGVLRTIRAVSGSINLLPSEELQKLNAILTQLDEKQFSLADGHVAELGRDPALPQVVRREYQDLAANYKAMKALYAHPSLPADQYAARVQKLKAQHLRLVKALSASLKAEVPPKLLAILESRPATGQPTMAVAEIVPSPVQSRMLRSRPGMNPRGPNGPPLSPAQAARQRALELRDRARGRRIGQ